MHGTSCPRGWCDDVKSETVARFLAEITARSPDGTALVAPESEGDRGLSYRDLEAASARIAFGLARLGFRRGDTLILWLPNVVEWVVLFFAAARLGVVTVPLNPRFRSEELAAALAAAQPSGIALIPNFLGIDFADILAGELAKTPSLQHVITIDAPEAARARATLPFATTAYSQLDTSESSEIDVRVTAADPSIVFMTSGTSSAPKLALHPQGAVARHARAVATAFEIGASDAVLGNLPFCGVFGFCTLISALGGGAACVLQTTYTIGEAVDLMRRYKVTHVNGSDVFLDALLSFEGIDDGRLAHFRFGGFADFAGRLTEFLAAAERRLGVRLSTTYGSSECFALMTRWPSAHAVAERSRIGGFVVDAGMEFRVVDPQSGAPLGHDVPGELQFRGHNVLTQYLGNPEQTARALSPGGWYKSGDLGYTLADGSFVYLARINDSLRLKGFLVDPREIESFFSKQPGVGAVQVVGVPTSSGDAPVAFIRAEQTGQEPSAADLLARCRESMASYKVPHAIVFLERFPTTQGPNGEKIQKTKLRELAREHLNASPPQNVKG